MVKRILFVCTGNTCRSPLAEGLFRQLAQQENLDVEVRSAGVSAPNGMPISSHSAKILRDKGADAEGFSSTLTGENAGWADLILTMTSGHKQVVLSRHPDAVEKVYTLKEYVENDPNVLEGMTERERFIAELQIKQSLGQPVTAEERAIWRELDRKVPDFDISDPFGGSLGTYRECADEIEQALTKLVHKLKAQ